VISYLSEQLTEEQYLKNVFDKGRSRDSVMVCTASLNNFEIFTNSKWSKTRFEVLQDLSTEYQKNHDTKAPIVLLNEFKEWLSIDHPDIMIKNSRNSERPIVARRTKSIINYLGFVKKWMKICGGVRVDPEDFKDFVTINAIDKDDEDIVEPLEKEEFKTIMEYVRNPTRRAKFYFMKCTASRHLESLRMKKKYIDFSVKPPLVRFPKSIVKGKTKTRYAYLDSEASKFLYPIWNKKEDEDYLFRGNQTDEISVRSNENHYWLLLMKKIGLDATYSNGRLKKRIHSIRGFTMRAIEKGTNNQDIAHAYGGHEKYLPMYLAKSEAERISIFKRSEPYMLLYTDSVTVDHSERLEEVEKQLTKLNNLMIGLKKGNLKIIN